MTKINIKVLKLFKINLKSAENLKRKLKALEFQYFFEAFRTVIICC